MLVIFVVHALLVQMTSGQDYKITQINSTSGLYYENIGQVLLSNSHWTFVTSVDYKGYLLFYEYLQQQAEKLQEFCDKTKLDMCKDRLAGIRVARSRIDKTDEDMTTYLGLQKRKRVRRFFPLVASFFAGAILPLFVGGSRGPDMSQYDAAISQLKSGQMELMNRINMQTTIFTADSEKKQIQIDWLTKTQDDIKTKLLSVETTFTEDSKKKAEQIENLNNLLKDTRKQLEKHEEMQKKILQDIKGIENNLKVVNKTLEKLDQALSEQGKVLNETNLKVELNSLTTNFQFLFDHFEFEQNKLFDAVKKSHEGKLDTYILSPLNLIKMLEEINANLPEGEELPFYPKVENAHHLYSLIKSKVHFHNYTLFFVLQIPLVHFKTFELYKITSLPTRVKDSTFAFILPKEPFLVTDKDNREYLTMQYDEFRFCKEVGKTKFLCDQTRPIFSVSSESACEIALLTTAKAVPQNCDKRLVNLKDLLFMQLLQEKSWIYLAPEGGSQISVNCDLHKHSVVLEGSGFIRLADKCKLRYDNNGIETLQKYTSTVNSNLSSSINLLNFIKPSDYEGRDLPPKTGEKYKNLILPFDLQELSVISVAVDQETSNLNNLYCLVLLPIVIAIGVIALLIYKKKIDPNQLIQQFSKRRQDRGNVQNTPESNSKEEGEKLKLRLKMNNTAEKVTALSIRGEPSANDPDVEYLTVRVKVKKDSTSEMNKESETNLHTKDLCKINNFSELNTLERTAPEDDIYGNAEVIKEDKYLKKLRKLKPGSKC